MITPRSVFRFIYGSFYFFLCILLVALLFVTPGDIIYQAYLNDQWYNIWILAASLVFIGVIVSFIYALRLYNNKTILASIPKQWVPIEKGDAPKTVIRMISASLDRSAAIAFESRPRVLRDQGPGGEQAQGEGEANGEVGFGSLRGEGSRQGDEEKEVEHEHGSKGGFQLSRLRNKAAVEEELGVAATPPLHRPVWGDIEHGGWASPDARDVPNLQYTTVLSELPHLIEAKALTQAPPDPQSATDPPMLDPDAVAMLERPLHLDLRGYINHLSSLGMLDMDGAVNEFLIAYERARFSTRPVSSEHFQELMRLFAGLLRSMGPMDPEVLFPVEEQASQNGDDDEDGGGGGGGNLGSHTPTESDIDDQAPLASGQTTPQSNLNLSRSATQSSRCSSFASRRRPPLSLVARNSSAGTRQMTFRTAPSTLNAPGSDGGLSRSSSADSFTQTRRPYHSWSNGSLRSRASKAPTSSSAASTSGASGSSVIRLAGRSDRTNLPYVLTLNDSR